ncbi:MAG: hypothetical protein P4L22_01250 [Candidatus Babeliales bacterium]|nr:hypothetical protein [Candidatus Babeliales bacterium]
MVDTFANKNYAYNSLISLAKNAGFNVELINFYNLKNKEINNYDSLFFIASPAFIENMDKNLIAGETIEKITYFVHSKNKLVGLISPHVTSQEDLYSSKELIKYLNMLSFKSRNKYKDIINWFLLFPIYRKLDYKTSLPSTKEKILTPEDLENLQYLTQKDGLMASAILPLNKNLKTNFPFGLYIKNSIYNNHFFLSKIPMLFFSEISEDFRINPVDRNLKIQMLDALQQTLLELKKITETQSLEVIKNVEKINLPEELQYKLSTEYRTNTQEERNKNIDRTLNSWAQNGIYAGWIRLDFDAEMIEHILENIANANLNLLWISIKPERYFSKTATGENREKYLQEISNFTKLIQEKYKKLEKPLPKIFISMGITTNFTNQPVTNSMQDIFAKDYSKVPAPLDIENLWKPELLDAFDTFYDEWQTSIGNGLNIDGIFLDLEMYHAQDQESSYPGYCDFSDTAWQVYSPESQIKDTKKRIKYLYNNNKFDEYFSSLEKEAQKIGNLIREHMKAKLPNGIIAVYMQTLPNSWFYNGILSGLSTEKEPVILATFNNEFFLYYDILKKNNIYALHMPVMLLSQFKEIADFKQIDEFKKAHDGIWFNRFSWLSYPYDNNKWWAIEASPLNADTVTKEIASRSLEYVKPAVQI